MYFTVCIWYCIQYMGTNRWEHDQIKHTSHSVLITLLIIYDKISKFKSPTFGMRPFIDTRHKKPGDIFVFKQIVR